MWFNPRVGGPGPWRDRRRWRSAWPPSPAPGGPASALEPALRRGDRRHRPPYAGDFQYFVGGGVAAFDCDDDGRSELFLAGGSEPAALYHNESPVGGRCAPFAPLASPVTDLTAVTGAYPLDVDSDGTTDLAVLRVGEDVVLRGLGDCRFERPTSRSASTVGTVDRRLQRHVGGRQRAAHAGVRRLPRADREGCEDSRLVRPDAGGGYAPPSPCRPGTARCRCCSATGAGPGSATCG